MGEAHKAGVDGVDAHAELGVLARKCLGQVVLRRLADIVGGRVRVDLDCAEAAQVHHRTILRAPHTSAVQTRPLWSTEYDRLTAPA